MEQQQHQNDDESEPWEALDVDESDLPFLRPCKRLQNPTSSIPLVPGPAAAVQAAMRRRVRAEHGGEDLIPTQEYIRRALDSGGSLAGEDDEDFAANPWLFALDFLRTPGFGGGDCSVPGSALSSIKNGIHSDRVEMVVAIVKSCTRTDLGGLMVTLKDRSGTMGASIHRKVLSEGEYEKNISVGAVLILKKVAVFAPSRSAYYLNVTLSNMVKVISKDSGPPLKQNYSTMSVKYPAQGSESRKKSQTPQETTSQERIQGIMSNLRKNSELRGSAYNNRVMGTNATPETSFYSSETYKADKESSFGTNVMGNRTVNVAVTVNRTSNAHLIFVDENPDLLKPDGRDNSLCNTRVNNLTPNVVDPEINITSGTEKHKQLPISSISIPDWTEEQLDQLGLFDD